MSGPFGSDQWMYSSGGYEIDQSARLYSNSYYQRTPSSASNRKTWTWSGWVKRGSINGWQRFLEAGTSLSDRTFFTWNDDRETFQVYSITGGSNAINVETAAKYRDPSSWYHVVVVMDTTQSTANDRCKIYINGSRVTNFTTNTQPSQNYDTLVNTTNTHYFGRDVNNAGPFDGSVAEINFIDGQALDASYFGETDADYGHWKPIKYTGTYGTNGYYLDFATQATDPIDASGNSNNWGSVNVLSTDWLLDSPTNNFCVMSPVYGYNQTLSEANLKVDLPGPGSPWCNGTFAVSSGKWYWEVTSTAATGRMVGICNTLFNSYSTRPYFTSSGYFYISSGNKINNNTAASYGNSYTSGDVIGVALDMDNGSLYFYKNGVIQNSGTAAYTGLSGYFAPSVTHADQDNSHNHYVNFGQDSSFAGNKIAQGNTDANGIGDFYYAPPSGYLALCTQNLPEPTVAPADHFNTVLYTGDGTDDRSISSGFATDLAWVKVRNTTYSHYLFDSLRGGGKRLITNSTAAEVDNSVSQNEIQAFEADGFQVGTDVGVNGSGNTYAAWNWKANGSGVSNTDGTITSTVSANQDAGFSIVSYTGTGTNATVGHGLGATPELVIWKNRDAAVEWVVQSNQLGALNKLVLNSNAAEATDYDLGNFSSASSTTFSLQNDTSQNASSQDIIAYCFHSVDGVSKVGTYTGNGSSDGPFVYTGFRPAFVMIKVASGNTGSWMMWDNTRSPENVVDDLLYADLNIADQIYTGVDFTSNGFKIRNVSSDYNYNGSTYIFMAFAENPFKYANAR